MVDFYVQHSVTKGTTAATAESEDVIVPSGIMHSGVVFFPAGCQQLVHCTINRAVHQIWPSDPSKNFAGEFFPINIPDQYIVTKPLTKITIWYWNTSTRYDHEVTVKFTVSQPEELSPLLKTNFLLQRFLRRLRM